MKMNKTMLLGEIATRSGIPADECGIVLKTFEKVLCEELIRKLYRYGGWILLLICISYCFGANIGTERPSGTDHSWNGSGWRLKIPYTVCDSEIV